MRVPLLGDAFPITMKQSRNSEKIFPYNPKSVSAGFQRVRNALGIEDLRYHDLRREGASRLFEKGYSIEEHPIIFIDRTVGESKMSKAIMIEAIFMVWRLRIWKLFGWHK